MKAFVIAAETIKDEAMFATYREAVPATVEPFGGKFIVRGGTLTTLEGRVAASPSRYHRISISRCC
jgi:uncharacterized protein (DUF1330 family)